MYLNFDISSHPVAVVLMDRVRQRKLRTQNFQNSSVNTAVKMAANFTSHPFWDVKITRSKLIIFYGWTQLIHITHCSTIWKKCNSCSVHVSSFGDFSLIPWGFSRTSGDQFLRLYRLKIPTFCEKTFKKEENF